MTTQLIIAPSKEHSDLAPISMTLKAGVIHLRIPLPGSHATAGAFTYPPAAQPASLHAAIPDEDLITWEDAEWQ